MCKSSTVSVRFSGSCCLAATLLAARSVPDSSAQHGISALLACQFQQVSLSSEVIRPRTLVPLWGQNAMPGLLYGQHLEGSFLCSHLAGIQGPFWKSLGSRTSSLFAWQMGLVGSNQGTICENQTKLQWLESRPGKSNLLGNSKQRAVHLCFT